jgi:hypothetical protein
MAQTFPALPAHDIPPEDVRFPGRRPASGDEVAGPDGLAAQEAGLRSRAAASPRRRLRAATSDTFDPTAAALATYQRPARQMPPARVRFPDRTAD